MKLVRCGFEGGFSLIELAIVMFVLGILGSGMIATLDAQLRVRDYRETEQTLGRVELALEGFVVANGARLPCPDADGDGVADPASAGRADLPCEVVEGGLPWKTLGVGRVDAWGQGFRYRPDGAFVAAGGIPLPPSTADGIVVFDAERGARLTLSNPDAPAAVVLSCGRNRAADGANVRRAVRREVGCGSSFTPSKRYAYGRPRVDFDDVTLWVSRNTLLARLVSAGEWPR